MNMLKKINCLTIDNNEYSYNSHEVIEEYPVSVYINGRYATSAMVTPDMLDSFAIGHLFTEKIIGNYEEIQSIRVYENEINIHTKNPYPILFAKNTITSGCGGVSTFHDTKKLPQIESNLKLEPEEIINGLNNVLDSELYQKTRGNHTVGIFSKDDTLCISEDIGRHNALDKVIGYGLKKEIDFSSTFIVSSGRISSEMVYKCAVSGVPVVVSKGATTDTARNIAQLCGMTLIGRVRGKKINIYTGKKRINVT